MWKSLKRFIALWMIFFSMIGCFIIWITEPNRKSGLHSPDTRLNFFALRPLTSKCTRQLQLWTDSKVNGYSDEAFGFHCPGIPCEASIITNINISTTKVSDGVVFFPEAEWNWDKMHSVRPRGQKWIFFSRENPSKTRPDIIPPMKYYDNSYDYTMTYRRGSDFSAEFGHYTEKRSEVRLGDDRNWAENKTGIVIGPTADFQPATWPRTKFIEELSSFISVNMYAECSNHKSCLALEEKIKSYKFSLALENSRCRDFISGKFFESLASGTVPIVDGPPREDYERVGPPNSFIHARDFATVQELADYITLLDSNDHLYNRFLDWKKLGTVVNIKMADLLAPANICPIFQRMYEDELKQGVGIAMKRKMPDWKAWWQGSCSY